MRRSCLFLLLCLLGIFKSAHAVEVRVSAGALERTLQNQLFTSPAPDGHGHRFYLRGKAESGCATYLDDPHVTFKDDRVVVRMQTHAKLGSSVHGSCVGVTLSTEAEVSFIPQAEGESIGFRDARIEHFSNNKQLDFLLEPFLANKLPAQMKVNAADLMRTLLVHAPDSTGYRLTLDNLKLHSMQVLEQTLVVDLDALVRVE